MSLLIVVLMRADPRWAAAGAEEDRGGLCAKVAKAPTVKVHSLHCSTLHIALNCIFCIANMHCIAL